MIRICPMPDPWNRVYQGLLAAWKSHGEQPPGPPVPLILGDGLFHPTERKNVNGRTQFLGLRNGN